MGRYSLGRRPLVIGACSFEERCKAVPAGLGSKIKKGGSLRFVRIDPVTDGFPDVRDLAISRTRTNEEALLRQFPDCEFLDAPLLCTEDGLLSLVDNLFGDDEPSSVILDITCFPKRFFCFLVAALTRNRTVRKLVVTYTPVPIGGYASDRLSEDPLAPSFLPGFSAPLPPRGRDMVLSLGFESLGAAQIVEDYLPANGKLRVLLPFPPHAASLGRAWDTLRLIVGEKSDYIRSDNIAIVSAIDVENVMNIFERWYQDASGATAGIIFAPFGPKPHTLAMCLFCLAHDNAGMIYSQPQVYNPDYSSGFEPPLGYIVKWDGTPCYERV